MKKLLSVVLALAIVISCFGILAIATGGTETPVAIKIVSDGAGRYLSKMGIWADDAGFTGSKKVTYTIYNPGDNAVTFSLVIQVTHDGSWYGNSPENIYSKYTVPAKSTRTITKSVDFTNGVAAITKTTTGYYAPSKFFARFEFEKFAAGDVIYVQDSREGATYLYNEGQNIGTVTAVTEIPTFDKLTGMNIEIAQANGGAHKYLRNEKLGSDIYQDMITEIDGKRYIVLQYRVYNLSDKASGLDFLAQNGWSQINITGTDGVITEYKKVPAKSSTDYTLKIPVTSDNKLGADGAANISALSLRFEVMPNNDVYTGQKFVVQALNEASTCFFNISNFIGTDVFNVTSFVYGTSYYDGLLPTPAPGGSTPTPAAGGSTPTPAAGGSTPTPGAGGSTPTSVPYIAAEFKEITPSNALYSLADWGFGKFLQNDSTFNGKIENSYVIYNTGVSDLRVTLAYNNDKGKAASVESGGKTETVKIAPGSSEKMTISAAFVNGVTTFDESSGYTVTLGGLRIRFDVQFAKAEEGNKFVVASATENANDWFIASFTSSKFEKTMLTKDKLPVKKIATGITLRTEDEADGTGKVYFTTATDGGLVTAANVKDGVAKRSFKIKNNSQATIEVKLELQALIGSSWKSPDGLTSQYYTIEPGKIAEVECEVDCENGKVEFSGDQVSISKLFGKFSIKGEGGTLPAGTSFTIYFGEQDLANFSAMSRAGWTSAIVYTAAGAATGDVLPVVLMTTVAVALVALVVVSKKRKEN